MKNIHYLLAILSIALIALSGCDELLDKVGITINSDYVYIDFTVNPDTAGTYSETIEVIDSNLDSLIEAEGQDVGELNSVKIKDATIEVMGDDGGNLDPFESFLLTIQAPGEDLVKIAEVTTVGESLTEIPLVTEEVDLSNFLQSDQYTIKVKTVLDQDLETHMNMRARVRYDIKVGL